MLPPEATMSEIAVSTSLQESPLSSSGQAQLSSMVWIVLFCVLMVLSMLTNTLYVIAVFTSNRTSTILHTLLCTFFLINLLDYCLLLFEFSLGPVASYPFSDASCAFYQFVLLASPQLCAGTLLLFIHHAYSVATDSVRLQSLTSLLLQILVVVLFTILVCLPSAIYSKVEVRTNTTHCTVDLSNVFNRSEMFAEDVLTEVYILVTKSMIPYWIPLAFTVFPVWKLLKADKTAPEKHMILTIAIAVAISFYVFHLPHAAVSLISQMFAITHQSLTTHSMWILNILKSFFLLISFFFHIFRPMVCLILDYELELRPSKLRHKYGKVPVYRV